MTFDERYMKKFINKLYKFIGAGHSIEFKKMRIYLGWTIVPAERTRKANKNYSSRVVLDPRMNVLSTFIHEFLHHMHPDWEECEILQAEDVIMKKLTMRQLKNITKRLAKAL